MRKAVLVLTVLIVTGLIASVVAGNKNNKQSASNSNASKSYTKTQVSNPKVEESVLSGTVEVVYEDSGFTPSTITVAKGTTINFINKTQIPLWVASDPHPEHTDYPGFDMAAKGSVPEPGQNASFTFDRVGKWSYHNHSAPEDKATVIVK